MVEFLDVVFRSFWTFSGTVILIMLVGEAFKGLFSINVNKINGGNK